MKRNKSVFISVCRKQLQSAPIHRAMSHRTVLIDLVQSPESHGLKKTYQASLTLTDSTLRHGWTLK